MHTVQMNSGNYHYSEKTSFIHIIHLQFSELHHHPRSLRSLLDRLKPRFNSNPNPAYKIAGSLLNEPAVSPTEGAPNSFDGATGKEVVGAPRGSPLGAIGKSLFNGVDEVSLVVTGLVLCLRTFWAFSFLVVVGEADRTFAVAVPTSS